MGIGEIDQDAWERAKPERKSIMLVWIGLPTSKNAIGDIFVQIWMNAGNVGQRFLSCAVPSSYFSFSNLMVPKLYCRSRYSILISRVG
jgi:hypothetical protein